MHLINPELSHLAVRLGLGNAPCMLAAWYMIPRLPVPFFSLRHFVCRSHLRQPTRHHFCHQPRCVIRTRLQTSAGWSVQSGGQSRVWVQWILPSRALARKGSRTRHLAANPNLLTWPLPSPPIAPLATRQTPQSAALNQYLPPPRPSPLHQSLLKRRAHQRLGRSAADHTTSQK